MVEVSPIYTLPSGERIDLVEIDSISPIDEIQSPDHPRHGLKFFIIASPRKATTISSKDREELQAIKDSFEEEWVLAKKTYYQRMRRP